MSNLLARVLTAVVVVPFLIAAIQWRNPIAVELIVLAAGAVGLREWMGMTQQGRPLADRVAGMAIGTALLATLIFAAEVPLATTAVTAGATVATLLWFLARYGDLETVAARSAFALAGYLYVGLIAFLGLLKARPAGDGGAWVYIALTIAWLSDTGAYFAGRFLGPRFPRKLYEAVSPKKTMVGAVGGLAASYGALVIAKLWYLPSLTWIDTAAIAVPANLLGQAGDLCESLVKRSVGVKDSGALLPGHGGMLDRIDALLFVSPYVFCYARWIYGRT
jgi:phosphatidate cytidylyltransferase